MKVETISDIDTLVKVRFDFLDADGMAIPDRAALESSLRRYYAEHLGRDFIALGLAEGSEMVSVCFLLIERMPPNPLVPNGLKGSVLNVLTYPRFRRRGYGTSLMRAVIDEARRRGLSLLTLQATHAGAGLYGKVGFESLDYRSMCYKLV